MATQGFYRSDLRNVDRFRRGPEVADTLRDPRHEMTAGRIPRKIAHDLHQRLQVVMSLIELRDAARAITAVHELADYINANVETKEDERKRAENG
jgi:hypothetical protein